MNRTYPITRNPICPNDRKECNLQDMDGYTNCRGCNRDVNEVRATGGMPNLEKVFKFAKKFFKLQ